MSVWKFIGRSLQQFSLTTFLKKYFICLFLAPLSLCYCPQAFSRCCRQGLLSASSARASLCAGFSCCVKLALRHRPHCPGGIWAFLRSRIKPVSPALAGGFLITAPPWKSSYYLLNLCLPCSYSPFII